MRFLNPRMLWMLAPVIFILPMIWYFLEKKASEQFVRFASAALLAHMLRGGSFRQIEARRRTRFILGLLALALSIIALARPQLGVREETIQSEGLDMVFLLDVSNSMLAEDIVPSRLKKAKHIIRNFVDRLSGDRAGVVAFAGSAYPAVPLTTDYDFLRQTLEVLDENSVANQGTDLLRGLQVGMDLLIRGGLNDADDPSRQQEDANAASRVVIVVSDGEAHEGEEAKLASKLKEAGIKVFTIGVGSLKGAPIPLRDQNGTMREYKKDMMGNMILTKLESANLEAIASNTGGKYYAASSNEGEVEEILSELSSLDRVKGGGRRVIVYDEIFQYPLALAVVLLLLMLALRQTKGAHIRREASSGASITAIWLAFFITAACGVSTNSYATSYTEYSSSKRGLDAYNEKDYAGAIQEFGKAQANNPDSFQQHMNLGDALLKSGSADGAASEFLAASKSKNPAEGARGAYNLGKAFEESKDFERAMRAYQTGLDRLSEDPRSDPEVELKIKRALEQAVQKKQQQQQQQQQQKNQDQNKDSKGQGQNDQQNQDQKKEKDQKYEIGKRKPEFKAEKLNESDAKKILKQLQEQEQKSQQRVMRSKTGKPKDAKPEKDW